MFVTFIVALLNERLAFKNNNSGNIETLLWIPGLDQQTQKNDHKNGHVSVCKGNDFGPSILLWQQGHNHITYYYWIGIPHK